MSQKDHVINQLKLMIKKGAGDEDIDEASLEQGLTEVMNEQVDENEEGEKALI